MYYKKTLTSQQKKKLNHDNKIKIKKSMDDTYNSGCAAG